MDESENEPAVKQPPEQYTGRTKSRWTAGILVFLFGPFGFLYFGFGPFFSAIFVYITLLVISGGAAAPFMGILIPLGTALCMDVGIQSKEYNKYEKDKEKERDDKAAAEHKKTEDEYYSKLGMSKLQVTLFGDPNAKKSLVKLVDSVKKSDFKGALNNLQDTLNPVNASKAQERREETKIQETQKALSNSCCSACRTQNEFGTKFCKECGESMNKPALNERNKQIKRN